MGSFADSLNMLWAVQKHDAAIVKEQGRIAQAARELAGEQKKVDAAKTALEAAREQLRRLKTQQKELEGELQRMDARAKQLEAQGTEAGSNAAGRQRQKIDEMENQGLELLGQVGNAEVEVLKAEQELITRQKVLTHQVEISATATNASQTVIDATSEVRKLTAAPIAPELLQVYTEANSRHPGNALARLDGEYCAACQSTVNTQLQMQVRARAEILRCPQCLRILDAPPK